MPLLPKWLLLLIMTSKQYRISINLELCTHYRANCGSRSVSTANHTKLQRILPFSFVLFPVNSHNTVCYFGVFFCIINILSPPRHRLTISSKVGELVQEEPNARVCFILLYTTFLFNPFVIFRCIDLLLWWRKAEYWDSIHH